MSNISVSLPSDGTTADVSDYNTPITTIVTDYNGNIDNSNIASGAAISGTKIASGSVTSTQINFGGSGAGVWWEEIGRTTLSVAGDTISITPFASRKYVRIIFSLIPSGVITPTFRFNNDSGNNYAFRYNASFATGSTTSTSGVGTWGGSALAISGEINFTNIATTVKTGKAWGTEGDSTASNAPPFTEFWFKWVNTSTAVTRVDLVNGGAGDFAIGSEVVVLGHD